MRVLTLETSGKIYTSQVYLVLGDSSRRQDINTLVDVGQDPAVMASIERAPTGIGKPKIEQVVLTHEHYDHCAALGLIREKYHPRVFAFSPSLKGVDCLLRDGDRIRMGNRIFEVIHAPGHSSDSVCLYNEDEGVLFAGDTPVLIHSADETYEAEFVRAFRRLCALDIQKIYFGHGDPLEENCNLTLRRSLELIESGGPAGAPRGESASMSLVNGPASGGRSC